MGDFSCRAAQSLLKWVTIIPIILYALVVLAAMVSLVVPDLHRRYAGGLWTATLLTSIIASVAFIGLVGLGD